ncbi:MAG: DegT/DnrJ/EryC1/StrS family aminotransferase [Candidatus Omnitrophica bacterium]|nr:DegT/DnrJ/EryC1/StrS family aminotransferase [Candidatus Omnitrophota bacterium]
MDKLAVRGGEKIRQKPWNFNAVIGDKEEQSVREVLESGILSGFIAKAGDNFLGGKFLKKFESQVRDYFKIENVVAVNSATAGLHMALGACGIGPGDEVIVTPYTMSATATAIIMQNAIPVFADIEDNFFCLDPKSIEEKITARTKAIMVVHLFGHPARMNEIMAIAKKNNLFVIEDCAQAPGALYNGSYAGTIGDIGIFSLNQHKTITCGEGGFAITRKGDLAKRMQLIRNHGEVVAKDLGLDDFTNIIGYNYRMTELEAAVSLVQFQQLERLNQYRIELADYLSEKLSRFDELMVPRQASDSKHVYFVYTLRVKGDAGIKRDPLVKALQAEGIPFGAGYVKPIYLEPMYQKKTAYGNKGCPFTCSFYQGAPSYDKGICPVAERMHEKELMLSGVCRYPHSREDMDDVVRAFKKILTSNDDLIF